MTRPRARELGITPGNLPTGPHNAITDVPGVRVGQVTLHEGERFHTGVTAIVPDAIATRKAIPAGLFVGNGYGKLVGATQIAELGEIETPIVLTGTLSAFRAADALVTWMLRQPGNEAMRSVNPVVGETNDGYLSESARGRSPRRWCSGRWTTRRMGRSRRGASARGPGRARSGSRAGSGRRRG